MGGERAGVGKAAAERGRVVFVDGYRVQAQLEIGRRHVVDRDRRAAGAAGAVAVRHRGGDRVTPTGRVVEVLVTGAAEIKDTSAEIDGRVATAIAPVDVD